MALNFSKLNPISGTKRFVSLRSMVELGKSIIKILIVGGIAYVLVKGDMQKFPLLIHQEVGQVLAFIARVVFKMCLFVCLRWAARSLILPGARQTTKNRQMAFPVWRFRSDIRKTIHTANGAKPLGGLAAAADVHKER